jgi:hypothetical protein
VSNIVSCLPHYTIHRVLECRTYLRAFFEHPSYLLLRLCQDSFCSLDTTYLCVIGESLHCNVGTSSLQWCFLSCKRELPLLPPSPSSSHSSKSDLVDCRLSTFVFLLAVSFTFSPSVLTSLLPTFGRASSKHASYLLLSRIGSRCDHLLVCLSVRKGA